MSEDPTKHMPNEDLRLVLTRLDSIDARLIKLEDKVDQRLKETHPIWEQVLTRLEGLETQMKNGFRKLERQVGLLAEDVMIVRADQRDLEKRLTKIESETAQ